MERRAGLVRPLRLLAPVPRRGQPVFCVGQALPLFLVGITLARVDNDHDSRTRRGGGIVAASARRRRRSGIGASSASGGSSRVALRRAESRRLLYSLLELASTPPPLDLGTYATFASASLAPGRRRSKNHPAPPHARHAKTRTDVEGSTPRHAAVCSAMVSGIL